jgi:uncharacterized protein (TIGR03437 family)
MISGTVVALVILLCTFRPVIYLGLVIAMRSARSVTLLGCATLEALGHRHWPPAFNSTAVTSLKIAGTTLVLFAVLKVAFAQQAGPALNVDANANRHAISADIYGISFYWDLSGSGDPAKAADIRATVRRWGGNNASTYHWKYDVWNIDADWFFEVLPDSKVDVSKLPAVSSFNQFADRARTTGGKILGTIPLLGWLPKARQEMCSFDVAKYGSQCKQDPYARYHLYTCGNGVIYVAACGDSSVVDGKGPSIPTYIKNDPTDAYAQFDESLQEEWIRYLVTRYGKANQGGITIWSLDNEPIWWDSTHRDIHPNPYTYDELLSVNIRYGEAIKRADPTALVTGPVSDNWSSLWFSKKDIVSGGNRWWSNPVDRNAHGGVPLMAWYLQQMRKYEQDHGVRLLDYLDVHAYIEPGAVHNGNTDALNALRLDSTREFWDPTYVVNGDYWIRDVDNNGAPVAPRLIPRLREIIDQNYPGTKIAISEYNWTSLDTLNGGLAQAELLGIFGREGLDMAELWGAPKPTDPGAFAFKMYRNYDGIGGTFGETSVRAASDDQRQLSIFAALRSDLNLTALVINKTKSDLASQVNLANFAASGVAKVWRYSGAKLDAIVAQPDTAISGNVLSTVFPANSITLLVIPPAMTPVPKPTLTAVTNAASNALSVAPGQMVIVWGTGMGSKEMAGLKLDDNGEVSASTGGVRILFDGVPAPMVYASATQSAAVVPYFGATKATTHVQVEYQGVRSNPLEVPLSATAPGLFTNDASGKNQGTILNEDGITRNSMLAPARPGSVVILWGTGEGLTDPPGVDGRLAVEVLPKPLAPVSVDIGGLPAAVEYAGAAPAMMPGVFQINARMSKDVHPGDSVPVRVKIGGVASQDGVTMVVR